MRFYLSSFKFGNQKDQLKLLAPTDRIGIIPNALDFRAANSERTRKSINSKILRLKQIGLSAEVIDLKDYFETKSELRKKITEIGSVFVLGGNVFILRQAMMLSGLDEILTDILSSDDTDFLYSGYSAAGCVLAPSLKPYEVVGDATAAPYPELTSVIWEGLGFVDFAFMPHWNSDHPEAEAIDRGIEYCQHNNIRFKAVSDGDVLIF